MSLRRDVDHIEAELVARPESGWVTASWVLLALALLAGLFGGFAAVDSARELTSKSLQAIEVQGDVHFAKVKECWRRPQTPFCESIAPTGNAADGTDAQRQEVWLEVAHEHARQQFPEWRVDERARWVVDPWRTARTWFWMGLGLWLVSVALWIRSRRQQPVRIVVTSHQVVLDDVRVPTSRIALARWSDGRMVLELWDGSEVRSRASDELGMHTLIDEVAALTSLPTDRLDEEAAEARLRSGAAAIKART